MAHERQFYINGEWVNPVTPRTMDVINPATEEAFTQISLGSKADVDRAVAAARKAFESFSQTTRAERLDLLKRILSAFQARYEDIANAITLELGAPVTLAHKSQAAIGVGHLTQMISVLETFAFEHMQGTTLIAKEPIGVVGMITPWNWPINQITCKVCPAIAAGCTMVLKPSEIAPLDAIIFAEVMHAAGVPPGVFNLVNGDGPGVGTAMSEHPDIDMISFTGSTRAGILIAKAAADTIKRVHQELGGKSANILLDDVDIEAAVSTGVVDCFQNSGQSCNAPTRMFVPAQFRGVAVDAARRAAESIKVGAPSDPAVYIGPVISLLQYDKIQAMIQAGIDEGATLVTGGTGRPDGLNRGYYVRPTVFADVTPDMRIAREEIFGPVLSILTYETQAEVIALANDTVYGLAAYVQSGSRERAQEISRKMRSGNVYINYPKGDLNAPFGGYKQSGNGREWGQWGLEEFLEIKGVVGYAAG
ncbi:aldehyde dehydrogenase family protein [Acidocella sp.]|uniref:aldehyde dehydrogenase family protein n=1 Tax=Acidocella sp. TaxID=50710 RepID=UPI002620905D|nr:aldehyde dehydrogenase family protein [Acidocella sp.]MDD2795415.1 aldehyde dehydrogenase family protein [Acidocella sp.]